MEENVKNVGKKISWMLLCIESDILERHGDWRQHMAIRYMCIASYANFKDVTTIGYPQPFNISDRVTWAIRSRRIYGIFGGKTYAWWLKSIFCSRKKGKSHQKREGPASIITWQHLKEDSPFTGKLNNKKLAQKICPKLKAESKLCDKILPLEIIIFLLNPWIFEKKNLLKKGICEKKFLVLFRIMIISPGRENSPQKNFVSWLPPKKGWGVGGVLFFPLSMRRRQLWRSGKRPVAQAVRPSVPSVAKDVA